MSFANPAGWWLATLVIPIIALHILKAQRTQVEAASTLEWERRTSCRAEPVHNAPSSS